MKRSMQSLWAGILSLGILCLTACGSPQVPTDNQTQQSQTQQSQTQAQGKPQIGGSLVLAITQEPDTLDPHLAAAAGTKEIIYNMYEGLMKLMPDGHFEPALAASYTVSDQADVYTFKLRKGVSFHNGETLMAKDVVYSIKRAAGLLADEQKPLISDLAVVKHVEAESDDTVRIQLKAPNADFLSYMTVGIVPESSANLEGSPAGTGPFKLVEYRQQSDVKIKRFDGYWRDRKAYLDEVTFKIYPSADAALVDLQAGKIDIFPYLTLDKYDLVKDQYRFIEASSNMVQLWALNNETPPFNSPKVREAMQLAINKQAILDGVTFGQGHILASGMAPAMKLFYNEALSKEQTVDIEKAKTLLKEAGVEQPLELTITVPGNYVIHVQTAELIAAQLEQIGVKAKIRTVDWGTWLSDVYKGRSYQSTVIALTFDYAAPSTVLGRYASSAKNNFINFKDATYDDLTEKARQTVDEKERAKLYKEMQAILAHQHASVFLQNPGVQTAVKNTIEGYTTYPMYVQDMYNVYFIDTASNPS